jgi:FkbM family methyltransferase
MLIFDIGANIGKYALANAATNRIIAVEASPTTYATLVDQVAGNPNIVPLQFAISPSTTQTVTFYECATANTLSTLNKDWLSSPASRFGNMKNAIREVTVPSRSLDSLLHEYGMPDLIKVDVEGAEHIVLQSLTQKVPLLCFEWASEWREQNKQCIDYLTTIGFTKFHIQLGDNYTYRPATFEYTADAVKTRLSSFTPKREWGMVWAC